MTATCEVCREKPARVRDFALRAGRWVEAEVCEECARKRRRTPFAILGLAAAAAALVGGAAVAIDAVNRRNNPGGAEHPAPQPQSSQPFSDLGRVFRPAATTLAQYSRDLTDAARKNELDPVIGRDEEVERVVSILARRSKNNPVLIGEPGVGKTAIVEGLAQRIARGNVPAALRDKRVLALSLGPLVAGTKYRGEFESRVKKILDEVKRAGRDIILFIDELHTLVGAGAAEGSLDLSSMIKPELARGELQCIGATTFDEYRKYVESDAALERRFQPVQVDEPTIEQTVAILKGLRPKYAAHHGVLIDDEALEAAATLAARYIADRYLPDKAIDVVDEAAAGAAMHGEKRVNVERVAAVVSRWTGIPQGTITDAQRAGLLALEEQLTTRVVGQDPAVRAVAEAIRRARAGLKDPRKPVGGFLFIGPSGVGKTELARALAHALFGTDDALVRLDLSEYTEAHTISRMLGAPPGYQGHEE
ncbi:MAG: ATP-dependent Clp protease ATP-binding subunit ClpC, partial [Candidatus Eremiobacteraeota bacterium]|nr:ATP-dependent Clp protease ATP-binding subunit ClpC [Candidatus Eremiobacteraeota bacterium]